MGCEGDLTCGVRSCPERNRAYELHGVVEAHVYLIEPHIHCPIHRQTNTIHILYIHTYINTVSTYVRTYMQTYIHTYKRTYISNTVWSAKLQ